MDFVLSPAKHTLFLEQSGDDVGGLHRGDRTGGDVTGWVSGDRVRLSSRHRWEGAVYEFDFDGKVTGDVMEGEADMGEYFTARFTARRHAYGAPDRPSRPRKNV